MTSGERDKIVKIVKLHPEATYDQIAKELGVSKATVIRAIQGKVKRPRGRKLNLKK